MSMIKLRLKGGMRYLSVGTPSFSVVIKDGGENCPDEFEVDKDVYNKYLRRYAEPALKTKKKRAKIESLELEE